jgi:hypothetical protein
MGVYAMENMFHDAMKIRKRRFGCEGMEARVRSFF